MFLLSDSGRMLMYSTGTREESLELTREKNSALRQQGKKESCSTSNIVLVFPIPELFTTEKLLE